MILIYLSIVFTVLVIVEIAVLIQMTKKNDKQQEYLDKNIELVEMSKDLVGKNLERLAIESTRQSMQEDKYKQSIIKNDSSCAYFQYSRQVLHHLITAYDTSKCKSSKAEIAKALSYLYDQYHFEITSYDGVEFLKEIEKRK